MYISKSGQEQENQKMPFQNITVKCLFVQESEMSPSEYTSPYNIYNKTAPYGTREAMRENKGNYF